MLRRRLYPMPIDGLLRYSTLPTSAFSSLSHLCLYFWANECRPLPTTQDELRGIARVHQLTWQRHRDRVLKAFEDIRPELEAYYDLRETKGTNLAFLADRGYAARTQRFGCGGTPARCRCRFADATKNRGQPRPRRSSAPGSSGCRMRAMVKWDFRIGSRP